MPTYLYVCSKCGHEFEYFQSMTAAPLRQCPKDLCARRPWGKGRVRRQLSAGAGLLFKGSGFYITDYRSESYTRAAKQEAAAASSKKDGAPKTDGKPAGATGTGTPKAASGSGSRKGGD
jgi:putative FmdB family regulatory protein